MVRTTDEGEWVLLGGYSDDEVAYPSPRRTIQPSSSIVGPGEGRARQVDEVRTDSTPSAKVVAPSHPVSSVGRARTAGSGSHATTGVTGPSKSERNTSSSVSTQEASVLYDDTDDNGDDYDDETTSPSPCPLLPATVCERVESRILGLTRRQFLYLSGTYCAAIYVLGLYSLFTTMGFLHTLDVTARTPAVGTPGDIIATTATTTTTTTTTPDASTSTGDNVDVVVEGHDTITTAIDRESSVEPLDYKDDAVRGIDHPTGDENLEVAATARSTLHQTQAGVDEQVEEKETMMSAKDEDPTPSHPSTDPGVILQRLGKREQQQQEARECYQYYFRVYKDMMWLLHGQSVSTDGELYAGLAFVDPFGDSDSSSFDRVPHSQHEYMSNVIDNLKLCPSY